MWPFRAKEKVLIERSPSAPEPQAPRFSFKHEGLFTVHVGAVGSGKTFSLMTEAIAALRRGEPVFTNAMLATGHLPDLVGVPRFESVKEYAAALEHDPAIGRRAVVRWQAAVDLLHPQVRCGKIIFDELGAFVNNRESDIWPFELTVKLIHLRKYHLSLDASVQDDEMADKNIRRFYNRVWFMSEWRLPFAALFKPRAVRPVVPCNLPGCTKGGAHLTDGDRPGRWPWAATVYVRKDVHPKYTQNKIKHESRGRTYIWFDPDVADSYITAESVESDAVAAYEQAKKDAAANDWRRQKSRKS